MGRTTRSSNKDVNTPLGLPLPLPVPQDVQTAETKPKKKKAVVPDIDERIKNSR